MSVRAMKFRGILAKHLISVVFTNGDRDKFEDSFSSLSPVVKRQYDELSETIESSQVVMAWFGKQGPVENKSCRNCNEECLSTFKYCPHCGDELATQ